MKKQIEHIEDWKNGISVYTQFGFDKFLPFN